MSLKALCTTNIVELIMSLPPMLRDEIIGETTQAIKKEAEEKAMKNIIKEIRSSGSIAVSDISDRIILSHRTGREWIRPEYTNDMNDDLYQTYVEIADKFFYKNSEQLVFFNYQDGIGNGYFSNDLSDDDDLSD
jgi:hypothetical protein